MCLMLGIMISGTEWAGEHALGWRSAGGEEFLADRRELTGRG